MNKELIKKFEFYFGIAVFIITSIYIINRAIVYSGILPNMIIARKFSIYSILVVLPFLVGSLILFNNRKLKLAIIYTVLSLVLIILAVVFGVRITLSRFSTSKLVICGIFYVISIALMCLSLINKEK